CATGGVLGVMFSVPLRRALVVDSDLPFPEGRAAAEVLEVGSGSREGAAESSAGLRTIVINALVATGFMLLTKLKVVADAAAYWFRIGSGATGVAGSLSLALIGIGHLVGLAVGMAILVGVFISRGILLPLLTAWSGVSGSAEHIASTVFTNQVRFIGAGVIGAAAIWTFLSVIGPVIAGIRSALASSSAQHAGKPHRGAACHVAGIHRCSRSDHCGRGRLYGRPDRLVEQPDFRHRHSRHRNRLAAAGGVVRAQSFQRYHHGTDCLWPDCHRAGVWRRGHFQRQPAGSENRPAGRRHAMEAAVGAGVRGRLWRRSHSTNHESDQ